MGQLWSDHVTLLNCEKASNYADDAKRRLFMLQGGGRSDRIDGVCQGRVSSSSRGEGCTTPECVRPFLKVKKRKATWLLQWVKPNYWAWEGHLWNRVCLVGNLEGPSFRYWRCSVFFLFLFLFVLSIAESLLSYSWLKENEKITKIVLVVLVKFDFGPCALYRHNSVSQIISGNNFKNRLHYFAIIEPECAESTRANWHASPTYRSF